MNLISTDLCPCGSQQSFALCCEPLLSGRRLAQTATQLMRSRYSANVIGDLAYLRATWWPDHCPPLTQDQHIKWCSLKITTAGCEQGVGSQLAMTKLTRQQRQAIDRAGLVGELSPEQPIVQFDKVSFVATYQDQTTQVFSQLVETSNFIYLDVTEAPIGAEFCRRWLYFDGNADWRDVSLGRNDVCLCGSGKKYKRCCG